MTPRYPRWRRTPLGVGGLHVPQRRIRVMLPFTRGFDLLASFPPGREEDRLKRTRLGSGLKLFDHSYEVGNGLRVHLLHCPAAMNLHGVFRSSQLISDLLIEHARDDHGDHLLLARSQRVEALFEVRQLFVLFTSGTILFQCGANGIEQVVVAEWFCEEFNRSRLHRSNTHWNIPVTRNKDDRDTNVSRGELALKIEAAQSTKSDVQHEATGRIWRFLLQEALSRVKALNLQTYAADEKLERRTY